MIRAATAGDEERIDAFLTPHTAYAMFLRSNLAKHGLDEREHPHGTRFFLEEEGGDVAGVFGLSNGGFVLGLGADWSGFAREIRGKSIVGINGASDQVRAAQAALNVLDADYALDKDEPHYHLDLSRLAETAIGLGELRRPTQSDRDTLIAWHAAYDVETLGATEGRDTTEDAAKQVARYYRDGNTRLLWIGGQPVAMTAFNARLPDIVQIGGVYTPPELRGRGHARTAVGLHLIEARGEGVAQAILFASGAPACRAYEALGFTRIGSYALAILKAPVVVGA
ncbi:GNAT family N-acetyltransferase [Maritimibacter dapengensis]|uniref:GNAT family N-acetyltransferase n=1 Tax=Maritimibacter dapengensis TaxID=2836868 RepID=A0ABS6SXW7_9RHOB|nr:GNAT family N-acetyltransferase [Maritimibacter dapengensis]